MLSIEHLNAGYEGNTVLRDFNLQVASGEIATIIGPNGSGKSTALRCMAGLSEPESGKVLLEGSDIWPMEARERARRLALLPQHAEGGNLLTVRQMVLLGRTPHLAAYGKAMSRDEELARAAMEQTGTLALQDRYFSRLSGGERQRVLMARALTQQPKVLLLDEPTSNLDLRYQFQILQLAYQLARRQNLAVVVVLHQINLAAAVADKMILLREGGVTAASGTPQQVMTEANLSAVYEVPLQITQHPLSGRPHARAMWDFE